MRSSNLITVLFICANLVLCANLFSQCPTSVILQSQTDVDEFGLNHANCDSINTIIINGQQSDDYIKDLSPLSGITYLRWDLVIGHNDSLASLSDLNISGAISNLRILNNPLLENLEGLENITKTSSIRLHNNNNLKSIAALSGISSSSVSLDLLHNNKLTSLDGLQNITGLSGLKVEHSVLSNFEGLNNVQEIRSTVEIRNNDHLKTFEGLNALTSIGGDTFDGDFFWLNGNDSLTSFSGLSNLKKINLNLEVFGNKSLIDFSGLENVYTLGGALIIKVNSSLKSITAIDNWNLASGHLSIGSNYQLDSCACDAICDYLYSNDWRLIENNGAGCDSEESILMHCPPVDHDNDGFFSDIDCNDNNADVNPDAMEVPYNGIDDDCNMETLDDDLDQDGFDLAEDCDDENAEINPDADEIANNGIDEDCNGSDLVSSTFELANTTLSIFPNPAVDYVSIVVNEKLEFSTSLYALNGKLVYRSKNEKNISMQSTPNGIYMLEIKALKTGQKIVEKLVVQR